MQLKDIKKVHVSVMTGKLLGLKAISTNTATNIFCIIQNKSKNKNSICNKCYSHTMLNTFRKNMQASLERNSNLLSNNILNDNQIDFYNELYIRYNAHGELINLTHLHNLVLIVLKNSNTKFALWTKRKDFIKKYFDKNNKPTNLILIYSNPKINNIINPKDKPIYFDKTFNNVNHDYKKELQNCTGQKCFIDNCMKCYNHNEYDTIVEAVKFNGRTVKE